MVVRLRRLVGAFILTVFYFGNAAAIEVDRHPVLEKVVSELTAEQYYSRDELVTIFDNAEWLQSVLDAMQNPAEYRLTWGKYRKIFIQPDRIQQGADFYIQYQNELQRAEAEYGVPASVIVAIIGVESKFGKFRGKHKVLDSLITLSVGYERRRKFFSSELKHFLILAKENGLNPNEIMGSYAGAMGYPQFIASSYRNWAVDFSGDGKVDLINDPVDAIGSIGNYLMKNGWKANQPISSEAVENVPPAVSALASRKRKVQHTAAKLKQLGATTVAGIDDQEKLGVLELNASEIVPEKKQSGIYIVRAGDTACQIAEKKKVKCRDLLKLNKLNKRGDIFRGQKLKIPVSKAAATSKVKTSKKTSTTKKVAGSKWELKQSVATNTNNATTSDQSTDSQVDYEQPVTFYTHHNFYVITTYNQSVLYAMAVFELSKAIQAAKDNQVSRVQF